MIGYIMGTLQGVLIGFVVGTVFGDMIYAAVFKWLGGAFGLQ